MKKKSIIILCSVVAICVIGLMISHFVDWPVNHSEADGDIGKAARFSREQASEKFTNMEELLQTDSAFKDDIVVAQVVMQTRTVQFGTLIDMSNEVAGNIPEFAEVLKDMNANREMVDNVAASLVESADNLDAALSGEECPDLAQSTINASLAYTTLQKQNNLATRFIETTDKYLETAQAGDNLKLVRDQWLEYQQMTAALDGDKASADALAKKGNLLSGEKALAAVENLDLNARIIFLQTSELALKFKLPSQIGSALPLNMIASEIKAIQNAQMEVLAHRKIDSYNGQRDVLGWIKSRPRVFDAYEAAMSNVVSHSALNQSLIIGLSQKIGFIIRQTAAANNSEKLNRKPGPPIEK